MKAVRIMIGEKASVMVLEDAGQQMDWDKRSACFGKLSMRFFSMPKKIFPRPEPVEGRTVFVQC
jgi:hypothetical protein